MRLTTKTSMNPSSVYGGQKSLSQAIWTWVHNTASPKDNWTTHREVNSFRIVC